MPLLLLVVLLVAGGAAFWWWRASAPAAPAKAAAEADSAVPGVLVMAQLAQSNIGLTVAAPVLGPLMRTIRATGMVGADQTRLVRLRPLARGRIEDLKVALGERVAKGQVLALYDNIEQGEVSGQLAVAKASLDQARADAESSRRALDRANDLVGFGAASRAEAERRNAENVRTQAGVRREQAEIERLESKLRRFGGSDKSSGTPRNPLLAPIDGVVIRIEASAGEMVDPDRELMTIADLGTIWVQADVFERDLPAVRLGSDATVSVAGYPDRGFAGRVTYVSDMLDARSNTARVRVELANPEGLLKLNMFANIEIASPLGRDALHLPAAAVQYIDNKPVLFVQTGPEKFAQREVELGPADRDDAAVINGLKPEEKIVVEGSYQLKAILLRDRIGADN